MVAIPVQRPPRNPNNDPPRIGELIHFHDGRAEIPGIVCRAEERDRRNRVVPATIFHAVGITEVAWLHYDAYDPTEEPAVNTWHFHHYMP